MIDLVSGLSDPDAYPASIRSRRGNDRVEICQTHISWIFLVGNFAYKVKKPITTEFLDYGSLEKRKHHCDEELRLDRRYADDLYIAVVPVVSTRDGLRVEGQGRPVEYAVKMKRFAAGDLLSDRLTDGDVGRDDVLALARRIADFHHGAARIDSDSNWGSAEVVTAGASDNLRQLGRIAPPDVAGDLDSLQEWTGDQAAKLRSTFSRRRQGGFVRECHGDLHAENVVHWQRQWTPFDGIEFSPSLRWIDVINDAGFLAMDFAARGHPGWSHVFVNAYLEQTADYASLEVLRWYLVYRALVRGKVAAIRFGQQDAPDEDRRAAERDCRDHVDLAIRLTRAEAPGLWITHGVSGSGKTTGSESIVRRCGAIRIRSDVERKRQFGVPANHHPDAQASRRMYDAEATEATYGRMRELAATVLRAGYSVVADATFLKHRHRESFRGLAEALGCPFRIVDFRADESTLLDRIASRRADQTDASDADADVLRRQLATRESLTESERAAVAELPD